MRYLFLRELLLSIAINLGLAFGLDLAPSINLDLALGNNLDKTYIYIAKIDFSTGLADKLMKYVI